MKYIQRKTNVRRHDRHTKHKIADVRRHERNLRARPILGRIPLKNLNYGQAKRIFPTLEPYGDIDNDAVINKIDCRPFDTEKQDEIEIEQKDWPEDERQRSWERVIAREKNWQKFREDEEKEKFDYEKHTGFSRPNWGDEDADADGVCNRDDCDPFDPTKQDFVSPGQRVRRLNVSLRQMKAEDANPSFIEDYERQLEEAQEQAREEKFRVFV